jgi:hypothetical protein
MSQSPLTPQFSLWPKWIQPTDVLTLVLLLNSLTIPCVHESLINSHLNTMMVNLSYLGITSQLRLLALTLNYILKWTLINFDNFPTGTVLFLIDKPAFSLHLNMCIHYILSPTTLAQNTLQFYLIIYSLLINFTKENNGFSCFVMKC